MVKKEMRKEIFDIFCKLKEEYCFKCEHYYEGFICGFEIEADEKDTQEDIIKRRDNVCMLNNNLVKCSHCGKYIPKECAIPCTWEEYDLTWYYCKICRKYCYGGDKDEVNKIKIVKKIYENIYFEDSISEIIDNILR